MLEIKKRGRWKSDNCIAGYEKSGKLAQIQSDLTKSQLTYFEATDLALETPSRGRLRPSLMVVASSWIFFRMIVWAVQPRDSECEPRSGTWNMVKDTTWHILSSFDTCSETLQMVKSPVVWCLCHPPVGMLRAIAADPFVPVLSLGELKNPEFLCHLQIWPVLTQEAVSCKLIRLARQGQRFNVPWVIENPEKSLCVLLVPNGENVQLFCPATWTRLMYGLSTPCAVVGTNGGWLWPFSSMLAYTQKQNLSDKTGKQICESAFGTHPHRPNAENMLWFGHAPGEMTRPAVQRILCAGSYRWHQGCHAIQSQRPCHGVTRHISWKSTSAECHGCTGTRMTRRCEFTKSHSSWCTEPRWRERTLQRSCEIGRQTHSQWWLQVLHVRLSWEVRFFFLHKAVWTGNLHGRSIASYIPCGVSLRLHICFGSSTSSCSRYPCLGLLVIILPISVVFFCFSVAYPFWSCHEGEMTGPAVQSLLCAGSYRWHQGCFAVQSQSQGVTRHISFKQLNSFKLLKLLKLLNLFELFKLFKLFQLR